MSPTSGGKGRLNFAYDFQLKEGRAAEQRRTDDDPLRILLLADLSGRAQRNVADAADLGSRPCLQVGLDENDSILMRYAPCIQWPIGHIDIQELEDFHPDRLYAKLDVFKSLRETRARLNDPSTFTETVRQLRTEEQTPASAEAKGDEQISPEDVFNRLLGQPASADQASRPSSAAGAVSQMIRQIGAPYCQPAADPRRERR